MENNIKFSVVIPAYNVEKYIEACIDSLINQTLKELQIIIVDDGSTDKTGEIIAKYAEIDPRIELYTIQNSGQSVARNLGIEKSKGKYLSFIDSDDTLDINAYDVLYNKAEEQKVDILYFGGNTIFEDEIVKSRFSNMENLYHRIENIDYIDAHILFSNMMERSSYLDTPCMQIYNLDFINKNNLRFIEHVQFEDIQFSMESILSANKVAVITDNFYNRLIRSNSTITKKRTFYNIYCYIKIYEKLFNFITTKNFDIDTKKYIYLKLNHLAKTVKNIFNRIGPKEKENYIKLTNDEAILLNSIILYINISDIQLNENEDYYNIWINFIKNRNILENQMYVDNIFQSNNKQIIKTLKQEMNQAKQEMNQAKQEMNKAKQEMNQAKQELRFIKNSKSYKIGRIITKIPRKLKQLMQKQKSP
ncbi:MAG: glycosyltransferase [Christensenellaceae bacterium]|nr:glycosyltransferase [Christensenellaceae bacterium]